MSQVGAFPGMGGNQRTIRAVRNPLDVCTVISIYPRKIDEYRETTIPRRYTIEPGSIETPSILTVGSASWWKKIDEDQPLLEITNGSIQVADSIVNDFCNGLLGCDMKESMPGLFWVPGEFETVKAFKEGNGNVEVISRHAIALARAVAKQRNYWEALLRLGDMQWAKTNGSPLAISDDMRLAAKQLGIENKDWMQNFTMMEQVRCAACGALRNPLFPVCGNCKTIVDVDLYNRTIGKTPEVVAK